MKSLNKAQVIGYVGKEPELRHTPAGVAVASFSVATTERWKDKTTGEDKERTDWHDVSAWSKLGELAKEYVKKGMPVYVEGTLRTDKYEKDGQTHFRTKIQAQNIIFLQDKHTAEKAGTAAAKRAEPEKEDPFGDDIPF